VTLQGLCLHLRELDGLAMDLLRLAVLTDMQHFVYRCPYSPCAAGVGPAISM